jgi:hypothetical protein
VAVLEIDLLLMLRKTVDFLNRRGRRQDLSLPCSWNTDVHMMVEPQLSLCCLIFTHRRFIVYRLPEVSMPTCSSRSALLSARFSSISDLAGHGSSPCF